MSLAAERICLTDRRLQRLEREVYRVCLEELDLREWRPLKRAYLARRVVALVQQTWHHGEAPPPAPFPSNLARAVRRLIRFGYLEMEHAPARQSSLRRYRLTWSPRGVSCVITSRST